MDKEVKQQWDEILKLYRQVILFYNSLDWALYDIDKMISPFNEILIFDSNEEMLEYYRKIDDLRLEMRPLYQYVRNLGLRPGTNKCKDNKASSYYEMSDNEFKRARRRLKFRRILNDNYGLMLDETSEGIFKVVLSEERKHNKKGVKNEETTKGFAE